MIMTEKGWEILELTAELKLNLQLPALANNPELQKQGMTSRFYQK